MVRQLVTAWTAWFDSCLRRLCYSRSLLPVCKLTSHKLNHHHQPPRPHYLITITIPSIHHKQRETQNSVIVARNSMMKEPSSAGFDANANGNGVVSSPPPPPQPLIERLKDFGQEDAFALWDELSPDQRHLLVKDIEVISPPFPISILVDSESCSFVLFLRISLYDWINAI